MLKKVLKITGLIVLTLVLALFVVGFIMNKPLPEEVSGNAENLTNKIENALHKEAWDSTVAISWTFAGIRDYVWDKKHHRVSTKVGDMEVYFNTQTKEGAVYDEDRIKITDEEAQDYIEKAWKNFANDSFWLIAPYKLRDPGTKRSLVVVEGDTCLKVTYTTGGVTPGDSYVWKLDEEYKPKTWMLWVSIIPVGGVEYGWSEWKKTATGAIIATLHKGVYDLEITNLKTGMSINEVTENTSFSDITF